MMNKGSNQLSFLTWNLYLGTDITPLLSAPPNQLPYKVTNIVRQVRETNFPDRVKAIAQQIAMKKPDLIGLQEAVRWKFAIPSIGYVTVDFVKLLISELKKRGMYYKIAAQNRNVFVEYPDSNGNEVQLLDRDVILITDDPTLSIIRKKETNFHSNLIVQNLWQSFEILRGWSSIDVCKNGKSFRLINTHLETKHAIQVEQAKEILKGPANTKIPLIITGDLNSNGNRTGTPTYGLFIDSGFQDLWINVGNGPGYTCCQKPNLRNEGSTLANRIDFILFKNGWLPTEVNLVGDKLRDRSSTGLWPSDHAGLSGSMRLTMNII
jgi:endonuclease/exonuclease/phosphatase family metal-dependent hydrolase